MIISTSRQYKTCYYKSSINIELFKELIAEHFENKINYNLSVSLHSRGLLFSTEQVLLFGLIKNRVEGAFSQRNDYSLLSIDYYSSKIFKVLKIILTILLLGLSFVLYNNDLKTISTGIPLIVLLLELIEYFKYIVEKRKFTELLMTSTETPTRIKMKEYYTLLGNEE